MDKGLQSLGMLTFLRSYSKDGIENYSDTVERYLQFFRDRFPQYITQINGYGQAIHEEKCVGSQRLMQFAGEAASRNNERAYNCCFNGLESFKDFADICYLLCCGCGVGASVEDHYIHELPCISEGHECVFVVPDSKEGWADSFYELLSNPKTVFDYSLVRPAGAKLSSGGTASGWEPLKEAHDRIRDILTEAINRQLTSSEAADVVCLIAQAVVSGGSRRSAIILLTSPYDELMSKYKSEGWWDSHPWRAKANISAVCLRNTPEVEFVIDEQLASPFGERGIVLVDKRDRTANVGINPCVSGDTTLITQNGLERIDMLVGKQVAIWNGFEWTEVTPAITGENQKMLKIKFSDGRVLRCTEYHKFHLRDGFSKQGKDVVKEAKDLAIGDRLIKHEFPVIHDGKVASFDTYAQGFKSAEGMDGYNYMFVYKPKYMCLKRLGSDKTLLSADKVTVKLETCDIPKSYIPFELNLQGKLDWLAGLLDGDGCELKEGGCQLVSVDREFLGGLQSLLTTVGVQSKVLHAKNAGMHKLPDGCGGSKDYFCQASYRICIGATQMQHLKRLGLHCERLSFDKCPNRDASVFVKVVSIEEDGVDPLVYCFTDGKRHLGVFNGVITGQCSEISLKHRTFCNLSSIVLPNCGNSEDFYFACQAAAFFGTLQATLTDFSYIHPDWKCNSEDERLIGVSLNGVAQAPKWVDEQVLRQGANEVCVVNSRWANKLGINPAKRCTTIKPEGSSAARFGCTSGMHSAYFQYGVRRIRITKLSVLAQRLIAKYGISDGQATITEYGTNILPTDKYSFIVPECYSDKDIVLQFPCNYANAIYRKDETAVDALERAKSLYHNWIIPGHRDGQETNNISQTLNFHPHEKETVKEWMLSHQRDYRAISTLPYDCTAYALLPFEELSYEEYLKYLERFPDIEWEDFGVTSEVHKTSACSGGGCEVT